MNNPYNTEHLEPQIPRPSGNSTALIVALVVVIGGFMVLVCGGVLIGLTLPAVQAAREAARRVQCSNNIKQIALALHNYEAANGSLPPAYTVDSSGQPLHSWRTLILPYIEQQALYERIDLTKPWDDPVNLPFSELVIETYRCPSTNLAPGLTTYVAVVDPSAIFSGPTGTKFADVKDGLSNTLLVAEVDQQQAVQWMSPDDCSLASFIQNGHQSSHVGGCNCAWADGAVIFHSQNSQPSDMEAIVTKDGGEVVRF